MVAAVAQRIYLSVSISGLSQCDSVVLRNPGRFFHALVGVGARARYVEVPFEGHKMASRESILHVSAEMLDWLDETIGPPAD